MKNIFQKFFIFIFRFQAKIILKKYKPQIIAITGNVGKTSTKEAVYTLFSRFFFTRKSNQSFNNEISLILTILGGQIIKDNLSYFHNFFIGLELIFFKKKYPQWLILEINVEKPKDMNKIISLLKTDVVIITPFGETPSHVESFKSANELFLEKIKLIDTLNKDGLLILNYDDSLVRDIKNVVKNQVITFGFQSGADVLASNYQIFYNKEEIQTPKPEGFIFRLDYNGNSLPIIIKGVLGINHAYAVTAAFSLAVEKGLNMVESANVLGNYISPAGRMKLLVGVKNSLIIDDSYNSSPLGCELAIDTLAEIKAPRKIAILGDMLKLGKHTNVAHEKIGEYIFNKKIDLLITVGKRAKYISEGAIFAGMTKDNVFEFEEVDDVGKFIEPLLRAGDLILIKGSEKMHMEKVVEEIMAQPDLKDSLLVKREE